MLVNNIVLVKILEDNQRAGVRPIDTTNLILSEICKLLKIQYKFMEVQNLVDEKYKLEEDDLVDCQILYKFPLKNSRREFSNSFLAAIFCSKIV